MAGDQRGETVTTAASPSQPAVERRLWAAADELRANSKLRSSEYSVPVLGLVFLRYAERKFERAKQALAGASTGRRTIGKADYQQQMHTRGR